MRMKLSLAALTAALAFASAASAETSSNAGGAALHRFGPDALQLRFEGETSTRSWPIYVSSTEARTRARIHLGFSNAISVMPEASNLSISVNDVAVAQTPIAAATDPGALDVELPRGLLTPGYNDVRITVSQRHRVDCSMEATYELWTQIDPASSGLAFPGVSDPHVEVLDDLAAISPDISGAVTIRAVIPDDADANAVENVMRAVQAVAIRADVQRPKVEIVSKVDDRAGLYVVAGQRAYLAQHDLGTFLTQGEGRTLAVTGQDVPGRVVVVAAGDSQRDTAETIEGILPNRRAEDRAENAAAALTLTNQFGYAVHGEVRVPLRDLGVRTEEFSGRLYRASFDITLPGDFYPADYDKLTLLLTAGYSNGLLPTAQILVRVNDREAGSMPMKNAHGDVFRDRPVSVSLSALRPGVNHVIVEAQTPDGADAACEPKHLMDLRKRFVLFDKSELVVPSVARIGRLPNLAATLSSGFPYQADPTSLIYVPSRDRATLSAVAGYLARTATVAGRPLSAHLTFDREATKKGSVLFIGALNDFASSLIEGMGVDYPSLKKTWSTPNAGDLTSDIAAETNTASPTQNLDSTSVFDQWAQGSHATAEDFTTHLTVRALYDRYINIHRDDFALLRSADEQIETPERATILLAQAQGPGGGADTWTLVVGANRATLARDMINLVAPSNWNAVEGRSSAFSPRGGAKTLDSAVHSYFIPTASLTPGNLRLIAAGFMSSNLDYYVLAIFVVAILLGLATRAAVRVHGNRS